MPKSIRNCLRFLSLLLLVNSAVAAELPLKKTWSLSHFMTQNQPVMLKSVDGSYDISFPVADRVNPLSAELNLEITNSNLLHKNRAQLVVYVNDYVVGQIKLSPVDNEPHAKFVIAKEYLRQGYNHITFKVSQHYTETQCEDWSAPELWTHINSVKSTLTLHYENLPITANLSVLNSLINDRVDDYSLSILRADTVVSDDYLYWGALIAQGVQLRLKHVPMKLDEHLVAPSSEGSSGQFRINPAQLKNDVVLVGTKAQLAPFISDDISQAITGAYLGVFQQDKDKDHFILVISGNDNQEVKKAAQGFTLLSARFPDAQQTVIDKSLFPNELAIYPPKAILPDHTYAFTQFGFTDTSLDAGDSEASMAIRLPPDLYGTEDKLVKINLNLAYGAAMRKDSVINISLNNQFNHAIQLKESEGAHYRNYLITIPLRSFSAGLNKLSFSTVLTPSEYGHCAYVQRDNLLVSIYQDSTITFPDVGRGVALPDLQLLERTSFPFVKNGFAGDTVFKVLDTSSDSIAATWHLIAKLTTYYDTPAFDLDITQSDTPSNKHVVLVGQLTSKNQNILEGAPVKLGELSQFPYQFKNQHLKQEEPFWVKFNRIFTDKTTPPVPTTFIPENVQVVQSAGLGDQFLLMSYPSPTSKNHAMLALLAEKEGTLNAGVNTLLTSSLWSQLEGNVFTWDNQEKYSAQREGSTFLLGDGTIRNSMLLYFSTYPWLWLMLVFFTLLLAAWVIHRLLSNHKKQTHNHVD